MISIFLMILFFTHGLNFVKSSTVSFTGILLLLVNGLCVEMSGQVAF